MTHKWKSSAALLLSAVIVASALPAHANAVDEGNVTEVTDCLKEQTLVQHRPSKPEGYFSASLEKALFCGHFRTFLFPLF